MDEIGIEIDREVSVIPSEPPRGPQRATWGVLMGPQRVKEY